MSEEIKGVNLSITVPVYFVDNEPVDTEYIGATVYIMSGDVEHDEFFSTPALQTIEIPAGDMERYDEGTPKIYNFNVPLEESTISLIKNALGCTVFVEHNMVDPDDDGEGEQGYSLKSEISQPYYIEYEHETQEYITPPIIVSGSFYYSDKN